jgi:bifunctional ADP-heptose synthase (sugar kinase/adenylyltransferase)
MDIQQQKLHNVLLIGDSCTDVYVFGECRRMSPEAPVPVFTKLSKEYRDGMASNVFNNLDNMLLGSVTFLTNNKKAIKKIRFVDTKSNQHIMRYDIENTLEPLQVDIDDLDDTAYDAIVISDYDKGLIDAKLIEKLKASFVCPIFVDTKKSDLSIFKDCIVKINEHEASKATYSDIADLIVTQGSKGALYKETLYETNSVLVNDVCGAGDVFLAALVTSWLETSDMPTSILRANLCASYSVNKVGTYHLSRKEYEDLCF